MFNNATFGGNTTIVVGHHNAQSVRNELAHGDIFTLVKTLDTLGVPADEIQKLRTAVGEDVMDGGNPSLEGKTGGWFASLLGPATKGTRDVGVEVVSTAVDKPLSG